jgi:hypothetical protein
LGRPDFGHRAGAKPLKKRGLGATVILGIFWHFLAKKARFLAKKATFFQKTGNWDHGKMDP